MSCYLLGKLYPVYGCKEKNKQGLKFPQECIDQISKDIHNTQCRHTQLCEKHLSKGYIGMSLQGICSWQHEWGVVGGVDLSIFTVKTDIGEVCGWAAGHVGQCDVTPLRC